MHPRRFQHTASSWISGWSEFPGEAPRGWQQTSQHVAHAMTRRSASGSPATRPVVARTGRPAQRYPEIGHGPCSGRRACRTAPDRALCARGRTPRASSQLAIVRRLSAEIADLYRANDAARLADQYTAMALAASELLASGFDQSALSSLSAMTPGRPDWLNAKAADFDARREPWQDEVASLDAEHRSAALNLRVVGEV